MKPPNQVLAEYGTTVFEVMSRLAREHDAINLGQGFPDGNGPEDVRRAAAAALEDVPNQYPPMLGVEDLRKSVAEHNLRFYGLDVDWSTEVGVTSGATEALAACLFGLLEPGDEVVVLEPLYDSYIPIIRRAGAVAVPIRLQPPDWRLPAEALARAFSNRTKLVLLNSPMNPSGKVFSREELSVLADLVERHDTYAVCDEVYEHLVFDGRHHIPLMTLPGMRERCARIGSAGKTFSLTGWKVGYVTAPTVILAAIGRAHQFLTFTTPPNLQRAVAYGLRKDDSYFEGLQSDMQAKRDLLRDGLVSVGMGVASCEGTYFLNADYRSLGFDGTDEQFCRHITTEAGVSAVPFGAFYADQPATGFARFCFCKQESTLDSAIERLKDHFAP
jgi:aspartate/methionine/tyrosine aminotransferase